MLDVNRKVISRMPFTPKEKEFALICASHYGMKFACKRYHCSRSSLKRWKKRYDGTIKSLENRSHAQLSPHWNAHTEEEIKHITDLIRRNPGIGLNELYGKLRTRYAYQRHPSSLFRFLRRTGRYQEMKKKRVKYVPKKYDTPTYPGIKMQLDVKFVPNECKSSSKLFDMHFYQYTIIDECTRERFIYGYNEHTANATIDFLHRAFKHFGYKPRILQTDNGHEFTYLVKTKDDKVHPLDLFCEKLGIIHKLIKPRTPRHNGKVERSHRDDNERFYSWLKFYSLDDLNKQMSAYLRRSNNIPKRVLNWKTPIQIRQELLNLV